jgi:hypothetical protein
MGKELTPAPHTGAYRAEEAGYHESYIHEGQIFRNIKEGQLIPHYLVPVHTAPVAPTTVATVEVEEVKEPTQVDNPIHDNDIRANAKDLGIRNWHNKKIERLKTEIADIEAKAAGV